MDYDMLKYAEDMNIFEDSQHGFMQGKSCLTNLLTTLVDITSCLGEGDPVDVIFLDYAKTFDSVPHKRLVRKLQAHGFDGKILKWIEDWLANRRQRVVVEGEQSDWVPVESSVIQGSVMGGLSFNIYIS